MRRKEKRQRNKFSAMLTGALILSTFFNAGASVSFAADNAAGGAAENGTEVSEQAQAQSFRIRTYNDRRAEDDQNIEVTVQFDRRFCKNRRIFAGSVSEHGKRGQQSDAFCDCRS